MRRVLAQGGAGQALPSNEQEEFHLRLIDLYGQHECLWNTNLADYHDVAQKRRAWESIAQALGRRSRPMTAAYVKDRINALRYRMNVYKLQQLEHEMSPAKAKRPEKLYYLERFAFLDRISREEQAGTDADSESAPDAPAPSLATAISEPRLRGMIPPRMLRQRSESQAISSRAPSIADMVRRRMMTEDPRWQQLMARSSMMSVPRSARSPITPLPRVAQPGESVSRTLMAPRRRSEVAQVKARAGVRSGVGVGAGAGAAAGTTVKQQRPLIPPSGVHMPSDEEDLYRMHWAVRQQKLKNRSQRQRGTIDYHQYRDRDREVPPSPVTWARPDHGTTKGYGHASSSSGSSSPK